MAQSKILGIVANGFCVFCVVVYSRCEITNRSAHGESLEEPLLGDATDTAAYWHNDQTKHWCIMVFVRSDWYDNSTTIKYSIAAVQDIKGPFDGENYKVYTIPIEETAPLNIAARVSTEGALLYICPHNPLRDRPLLEIEKLFEKTSYGAVMLVVILPKDSY